MTAVAFGVGGHGQHGADEYADITTIAPYYQALTQFLQAPWADEADGGASRLSAKSLASIVSGQSRAETGTQLLSGA